MSNLDYRDNVGLRPVMHGESERSGACMSCGKTEWLWLITLESKGSLHMCDVCLSEIERHHRMWRPKAWKERRDLG